MKCWGKGTATMAKRDHSDKMFTLGQLKGLYKTVIALQKDIKKLEAVRKKDNEKPEPQLKGNN